MIILNLMISFKVFKHLFSFFLFTKVDGNWSDWASWTRCRLECGNGTQVRGRVCTNPEAQYGGRECVGDLVELQRCNVHPCPSKLKNTV